MTQLTEQQEVSDWLQQEKDSITVRGDFEDLPSMKLEAGKIVHFIVDFSKPFGKWEDKEKGTVKKIIPVMHDGARKHLWLNVKNPLYSEIVTRGLNKQIDFKVVTTGTQKDTKYVIVE